MFGDLPEDLNLADRFLDARIREGRGARTALIAGDRRVSYAEVQAAANRFANVLVELGVEPEERVIVGLPDIPEYVAALFGTLKNGSVVVMVNPGLDPDNLRVLLRLHARPRRGGARGPSGSVLEGGARRARSRCAARRWRRRQGAARRARRSRAG